MFIQLLLAIGLILAGISITMLARYLQKSR